MSKLDTELGIEHTFLQRYGAHAKSTHNQVPYGRGPLCPKIGLGLGCRVGDSELQPTVGLTQLLPTPSLPSFWRYTV